MIELETIPDRCKVCIIIPIHRPGKCRDSPESYRPITLISAIYKFFERIFLTTLHNWTTSNGKSFPNRQQNAYQKHLGSLTVSFHLQETIAHNTELKSGTYVASLDSSKAFDNVWHDGLFSKVYDFGISGKALNLLESVKLCPSQRCKVTNLCCKARCTPRRRHINLVLPTLYWWTASNIARLGNWLHNWLHKSG